VPTKTVETEGAAVPAHHHQARIAYGGSPDTNRCSGKGTIPTLLKRPPLLIGINGHSAGGYATLALLTRSRRFAAAMVLARFGSVLGYYLQVRSTTNDRFPTTIDRRLGRLLTRHKATWLHAVYN
jgi:hypothetical protein